MATIQELREQQARIATNARSKYDEIKDDTAESRAAEIEAEFDAMMAEVDKINGQIERMERLEAVERQLSQGDPRRPIGENAEARGQDDGAPLSYQDAFHAYMRAQGNVGAMSSEARSVLESGYQSMSAETRAQTTTDAAGGYSIPETMLERVIVSMAAWGPMYEGGPFTVINTTGGNSMPFPTVDDTASTAEDHTEGATLTDDGGKDVTFGTKQLDAYAYDTEWLRISKELTDDSFIAMETFIGGLLGERLARKANAVLTTGSGSSAPHGIATAAATGNTATSATAIAADEILELVHSVDPAYRRSPVSGFMFNDATLLALRKLKDGQGNYLITNAPDGSGRLTVGAVSAPYWINQDMAGIAASNKSMIYGDMSKYFVRKVGQPLIGAIQDKDFWPGFGIAGYIRLDGELADAAAIKALAQAAS